MAEYFRGEQWVDSYIGAARDVIIKPGEFFDGLPEAAGYGPSIMFLTTTLAVPFLVYALMSFGMALLIAPLFWLLAVAAAWLWAWYLGWAVRTFAKQTLDTVNAFQLCTYANVPMLLSWIPLAGIVLSIWSVALQWQGLTRRYNVSSGTAMAILLVPLLVLSISAGILAVLAAIFMAQHGMEWPAHGWPMRDMTY